MPGINLPKDVEGVELSMFKTAFAKEGKPVQVEPLLRAIASGRWQAEIAELRKLIAEGKRDEYDQQKRNLGAVTVSGRFEGRTQLLRHSGLLQGDFDKLPNSEEIRDVLGTDHCTVAAFLSPSGSGVKALLRIPDDPEQHLASFRAAERYFSERYGLELDASCKDTARICFVSHDPELRTNPNAVVLDVERWAPEEPHSGPWTPPKGHPQGSAIRYGTTDWKAVFESAGLVQGTQGSRINVLCPFRESHTANIDGGSYLFPGREGGWGWTCQHAHCQTRTLKDVSAVLWDHVVQHSEPWEPDPKRKQRTPPFPGWTFVREDSGIEFWRNPKTGEEMGFGEAKQDTHKTGEEPRPQPPPLTLLSVRELLAREIPEQDFLLRPILKEQGTGLLWAYRGVGKSWAALGIAVAVASGGKYLCWEAPNPNGVLFIDGELPLRTLQERVGQIIASTDKEPSAPLHFLTPDVQEFGLPDLSTAEGQQMIEPFITDEIKLVILDNLSTLCRSGVENEAESWLPVQEWALSLRRRGKSVLFIHHGNKGGGQRGTSRREDILDTVIKLRRPGDYSPDSGAVFEVHLDKARGIHGDAAKPFEAKLETDESGKLVWTWKPLEETTFERVLKMLQDGMPCKAIAFELGISQSAVYKHRKRAQSEGKLPNSTSQPA